MSPSRSFFWRSCAPLLALLWNISPGWAQVSTSGGTVLSNFDDMAAGVVAGDPARGILYPDSPEVVNVAQTWSGASTFSSPNALRNNAEGVLRVAFVQAVGRVRLRVGNPANGNAADVVLRAYGSPSPSAQALATTQVRVSGNSAVWVPLEVARVFAGDIVRVEVEMIGQRYIVIDDLEYETIPSPSRTIIGFDEPGRVTDERIQNQYEGVSFPDLPLIAWAGSGASSAPHYLRSPLRAEASDPLPMVIQFNPPQGAVGMRVGSSSAGPITVSLRAYRDGETTPVATAVTLLAPGAPVATALEVARWTEHDISRVEVQCSGGEWECIDDLTFGPFLPGIVVDTVVPIVTLLTPANGIHWRRLDYILYYAIFAPSVNASHGSCVGLASTSALFFNGDLLAPDFDPHAAVPAGLFERGVHRYAHSAGPSVPVSLWSHVRANHGVQMSNELIQHALDQMGGGLFSISGDPVHVLNTVRTDPTRYVLCMTPSVGKGHAVLPYRVDGNRIYVYDNNRPYDNRLPEDNADNILALNCCIEVFPSGNTFNYQVMNWGGTGLYEYPLSTWQMPRTGAGLTAALRFVATMIVGSADEECVSPDGGRWGWDADGHFEDALPGAKSISVMGNTQENRHAMLLLPTDSYSSLGFRAHPRDMTPYIFHASFGGRVLQMAVDGSRPGDADSLNLDAEAQRLNALSFRPQRAGVRFVPRLAMTVGEQQMVYQWSGLDLPPSEEVELRAAPSGQNCSLINRSSRELHPRLMLMTQDNATNAAMAFEVISIPAGATCRFVPQLDPGNARVNVELDFQGNGASDQIIPLVGRSVRIEDNPGQRDHNSNGVVDEIDLEFETSQDLNSNGIPDEAETAALHITPEDGDWAAKAVAFRNTPEADLMARTGDIDNLGFGWPSGFNPFTGQDTPVHAFPWTPESSDPTGTDRIMVPSSYNGNPPHGEDGYVATTSRPANNPESLVIEYGAALGQVPVRDAWLQLRVDDFQAHLWGAQWQVLLNGSRAPFLEELLNALDQTGPVGKLVSVRVPDEFLPAVATGSLSMTIDDPLTGAGDGIAIDFVKLLVNPRGAAETGSIHGIVSDAESQMRLDQVLASAGGMITMTTGPNGELAITNVPAGLLLLTLNKQGYLPVSRLVNVVAGRVTQSDVALERQAPPVAADVSVSVTANVSSLPAGEQITYTITVFNNGPNTATSIVVQDALPALVELVRSDAPDGVKVFDSPLIYTFDSLPAGASRTLTVVARPTQAIQIHNEVAVFATEDDPNLENNVAWVLTDVTSPTPPEIHIVKFVLTGEDVVIVWAGGQGQLQRCNDLVNPVWHPVGEARTISARDTVGTGQVFYRVLAQ